MTGVRHSSALTPPARNLAGHVVSLFASASEQASEGSGIHTSLAVRYWWLPPVVWGNLHL